MTENKNLGRELDWNETIDSDGQEFALVPPGEYFFTVVDMEKKRFPGSVKMCGCPQAVIKVRIDDADGNSPGTVEHNLYLNEKCFGLLSAFFRSIGQKEHGKAFVPRWNEVVGSKGRCKVTTRKFKKQDGSEGESNDIQFLDPANPDLVTEFKPDASW